MMSNSRDTTSSPDPRRWLILAVIAVAQLMVVLDISIVNIALPSAQASLHFSDTGRQWIITAYALAFGSLLLFGGKLGDILGRRVTFITGLVGFAAVSAVGGAADSFAMLVAARACQGAFGALLAPAALSLLTTTFSDPGERGKAFGVYGSIVAARRCGGPAPRWRSGHRPGRRLRHRGHPRRGVHPLRKRLPAGVRTGPDRGRTAAGPRHRTPPSRRGPLALGFMIVCDLRSAWTQRRKSGRWRDTPELAGIPDPAGLCRLFDWSSLASLRLNNVSI